MPLLTKKFSLHDEPILDVSIQPSKATITLCKQMNIAPPQSQKITAMIDTGASFSAIDSTLITKLKFQPIDQISINTTSCKNVNCLRYEALVCFSSDINILTKHLVGVPLYSHRAQCLIGRDILQHFMLVYNGPERTITLAL